jgi:hypothetical protein
MRANLVNLPGLQPRASFILLNHRDMLGIILQILALCFCFFEPKIYVLLLGTGTLNVSKFAGLFFISYSCAEVIILSRKPNVSTHNLLGNRAPLRSLL